MESIINDVEDKMDYCLITRDIKSITREWAGRNRLYRLKICRNKLKEDERKKFRRIHFLSQERRNG